MSLSPLDLALITFKELRGNLVRSGLTALGIFMGVAASSFTLNIRAVTHTWIQEELARRDTPHITPGLFSEDFTSVLEPKLTEDDIHILQQTVSGILGISTVREHYNVSTIQDQGQEATGVKLLAVSDNYQKMTGRKVLQGRFFEAVDFEQYRPVAIIDQALADKIFKDENPVGRVVYVGGTGFTVVGVAATSKQYSWSQPPGELWVTLTYGDTISGASSSSSIQIALVQFNDYQDVKQQVEEILRQRYPNFEVWTFSNVEDLIFIQEILSVTVIIMNSLAVLLLFLGGVGIANITIASVVERTREVGLRRAVGATDMEVMLQFIAEMALLSVTAGATAIFGVHLFCQAIIAFLPVPFPVTYQFRFQDASMSAGAALAVGFWASFFPALRVTRIDVVQALRGE